MTGKLLFRILVMALLIVLTAACAAPEAAPEAAAEAEAEEEMAEETSGPRPLPADLAAFIADHEPGTLITEEEWYEFLGDDQCTLESFHLERAWTEAHLRYVDQMLMDRHPNVTVEYSHDIKAMDMMRLRLAAGDPMGVSRHGIHTPDLPVAAEQGFLLPITILLDTEITDEPGVPIRDRLNVEGVLAFSYGRGTDWEDAYSLGYDLTGYGLLFNYDLFVENGWSTQPQTWEEFLDLTDTIRESGMAPICGRAGHWDVHIFTNGYLITKAGGPQAAVDMCNLEEGAFRNEAVVWAHKEVQKLYQTPGNVPDGAEAMDGNAALVELISGNCAMRMGEGTSPKAAAALAPDDFRWGFMWVPGPADGKGRAVGGHMGRGGGGQLYAGNTLPANCAKWGLEWLRLASSHESALFFLTDSGTPLYFNTDISDVEVAPHVEMLMAGVAAAEDHTFVAYPHGHPSVSKIYYESRDDLVYGDLTVEEFIENVETEAARVRASDDWEHPGCTAENLGLVPRQ